LLLNVRRHAELPHCQRYGPAHVAGEHAADPYT